MIGSAERRTRSDSTLVGSRPIYRPPWRRYPAFYMSDPKVDAMGRVPLFSRCTRKELEFLASRADEVDLKLNSTLTKQGAASDCFYRFFQDEASVQVDGKP